MFRILKISCLLILSTLAALHLSAADLPPDVQQCLNSASVGKDGLITGPSDCRKTLTDYMTRNWRSVLAGLDEIAPSDATKILVIRACEPMPAVDYLVFLENLRDLRIAGKIDDQVLEAALVPSSWKEGFLALNCNNPRVLRYLGSLHGLLPSGWNVRLDEISSGAARDRLLEKFSADGISFEDRILPSRHNYLFLALTIVAMVLILCWAVFYWKLRGKSAYYWRGDGS